jgi:hypothetical protein
VQARECTCELESRVRGLRTPLPQDGRADLYVLPVAYVRTRHAWTTSLDNKSHPPLHWVCFQPVPWIPSLALDPVLRFGSRVQARSSALDSVLRAGSCLQHWAPHPPVPCELPLRRDVCRLWCAQVNAEVEPPRSQQEGSRIESNLRQERERCDADHSSIPPLSDAGLPMTCQWAPIWLQVSPNRGRGRGDGE